MSTYNPNNPFSASTATVENPWVTFGSPNDAGGARNPFDLPGDTVSPFDIPNDTNPTLPQEQGYGLRRREKLGDKVVRTLRSMGRRAMEALRLSGSKSPEGDQLPFGFAAQPVPDLFGAQAEIGLGGWGTPVEVGSPSRWDAFSGRATTVLGVVNEAIDTARVAADKLDRYGNTWPGRAAGLDGAAQAVNSALNTYDTAKSAVEGLHQNPEELKRIAAGMGKRAAREAARSLAEDTFTEGGVFSKKKTAQTVVKTVATRGSNLAAPTVRAVNAGLRHGLEEAAQIAQSRTDQDRYERNW